MVRSRSHDLRALKRHILSAEGGGPRDLARRRDFNAKLRALRAGGVDTHTINRDQLSTLANNSGLLVKTIEKTSWEDVPRDFDERMGDMDRFQEDIPIKEYLQITAPPIFILEVTNITRRKEHGDDCDIRLVPINFKIQPKYSILRDLVRDNRLDDEGTVAVTATITQYVDASDGKYTVFVIEVTPRVTPRGSAKSESWSVSRRFNDFKKLDKALRASFTTEKLPALPPNTLSRNRSTKFLNERQAQLQLYLNELLELNSVSESQEMDNFLQLQLKTFVTKLNTSMHLKKVQLAVKKNLFPNIKNEIEVGPCTSDIVISSSINPTNTELVAVKFRVGEKTSQQILMNKKTYDGFITTLNLKRAEGGHPVHPDG